MTGGQWFSQIVLAAIGFIGASFIHDVFNKHRYALIWAAFWAAPLAVSLWTKAIFG